jgi:hypothetical protein
MRSWLSTKLVSRSSSTGGSSDSLAPSTSAAGGFGTVEDFSAPRQDPRVVSPEKDNNNKGTSSAAAARSSSMVSLERHFQESFRVGSGGVDGEPADLLDGNSSVQTEDFLAAFKSDDDQSQASSALLFDEAKYAADDDDDDDDGDDDSQSLVSSNSAEWKAMHASVFLQDLMGSDSNRMDLATALGGDNHHRGTGAADEDDESDDDNDHDSAEDSPNDGDEQEHTVSAPSALASSSGFTALPTTYADEGRQPQQLEPPTAVDDEDGASGDRDDDDDDADADADDDCGHDEGSHGHNESGEVSRRSDHSHSTNSRGDGSYDSGGSYHSRRRHDRPDEEEGSSDHPGGASVGNQGSESVNAGADSFDEGSDSRTSDHADASRGSGSDGSCRQSDDDGS